MTSTTDTAGHPDVEELSDLTEGLLPPSRTTDVRRHLDGCDLCTDVYDSLEEIRGVLGTLPGPTRMPDDVAGRIDAALAAEALLNASAPDIAAADAAVSSSRAVSHGNDGSHVSRETSIGEFSDRPTGHPRAAAGPGRAHRSRRARRRTFVLGGVFTAAALGLSALLVQSLSGDKEPPSAIAQTDAAHSFSEGTLENQVTSLLTEQKSNGNRKGGRTGSGKSDLGVESEGSGSVGPNTLDVPTVRVPDCIDKGINSTEAPIAVEQGVYKGTKVYLVVLTNTTDNTRVTAYIVDAACMKQAPVSPGKVLLKRSYPRP